jgi:hypothetical protein
VCSRVTGASGVTNVLNYVDLQVITNTECASVFGSYIVSSTLCLATPGGKSTCSVSHTETDILLFYLTAILSSVTKVIVNIVTAIKWAQKATLATRPCLMYCASPSEFNHSWFIHDISLEITSRHLVGKQEKLGKKRS